MITRPPATGNAKGAVEDVTFQVDGVDLRGTHSGDGQGIALLRSWQATQEFHRH